MTQSSASHLMPMRAIYSNPIYRNTSYIPIVFKCHYIHTTNGDAFNLYNERIFIRRDLNKKRIFSDFLNKKKIIGEKKERERKEAGN
jgi:hypothetical protein